MSNNSLQLKGNIIQESAGDRMTSIKYEYDNKKNWVISRRSDFNTEGKPLINFNTEREIKYYTK